MIKSSFIATAMLLFSSFCLSAQETYPTDYEVQYALSYSIDSLNLDNKEQEVVYLYTGKDYGGVFKL